MELPCVTPYSLPVHPPISFNARAARTMRERLGMAPGHVAYGMRASYGMSHVSPDHITAWERGDAVPPVEMCPRPLGSGQLRSRLACRYPVSTLVAVEGGQRQRVRCEACRHDQRVGDGAARQRSGSDEHAKQDVGAQAEDPHILALDEADEAFEDVGSWNGVLGT